MGYDGILIEPPRPGACPVCAFRHGKEWPHNPNSLYYRMKFRQEHGRAPGWEDASAHCTEQVKQAVAAAIAEHGQEG